MSPAPHKQPAVVRWALGCLGVIVVLAMSANAPAETAVDHIPGPTEGSTVIRGDGSADRITVAWLGDRQFEVASLDRLHGNGCSHARHHRIRCRLGEFVADLELEGNAGPDRLTAVGRFPGALFGITGGGGSDLVAGGLGDDILIGSQGDDFINGGPGDDSVNGESGNAYPSRKPGDDALLGGRGNDELGDYFELGDHRFLGGPGRDEIDATDDARDRVIDGGPGEDLCRIDEQDPRPRSCEQVRVVDPTPYD